MANRENISGYTWIAVLIEKNIETNRQKVLKNRIKYPPLNKS